MKKVVVSAFVLGALFTSCSSDDDNNGGNQVVAPPTYEFTRNGATTVDYNGQTTRIEMGEEFVTALKNNARTEAELDGMYNHQQNMDDFSDPALNGSDKNMRSKTADSYDYFESNTTEAAAIKTDFDGWIAGQVNDVFTNWSNNASAGVAGQIQENGGGSIRYVNAKGLEYNQAINKGLIGALMVDQMLNNYLSTNVLDAGSNVENNNNEVLESGKNYTKMEHKWDEAFGYLYGTDNAAAPALGADSFLNKYLGRVENDPDYAGISQTIYNAFKLGRAAIEAKNYTVRDQQANIIREEVSKIIAVRAIYYLQQGKIAINNNDNGAAFHDLSEGFGFIYSLQFTRQPNTSSPYYSRTEVQSFINQLMEGNGFWDVTPATLDAISLDIATTFGISVADAGN